MADLYRKSSVEKLSSPEQLDRSLTITSPLSWLALFGVTLIIVVTLLWSFTGTLPTTMDAMGVLVSPEDTMALFTDETGTVDKLYIKAGDVIHAGDMIADITNSRQETVHIQSDQEGIVTSILVESNAAVVQGTELVRLSPQVEENQVAVLYVPLSNAQSLKPGIKVLVTPSFVDGQSAGHMEATILHVDSRASTSTNLAYVLGTDNMLVNQFTQNGAVVAVTCEMKSDNHTVSKFYWSNKNGESIEVPNGTLLVGKIITKESAPINKLVNNLKEKLGG